MTQKIKCRESYDRGYQKGKELVNENEIREVLDSLNRIDETLITEALLDLDKKYDTEFMSLYIKVLMKKIKMFKTSLERDLNQEVEWASEHLTSEDAKEKLKLQRQEGILSRKIMKGQIDSMAATTFLQDWMNQR